MNTHSDVSDRPPHSPSNSSESQAKKFVREEFLARLAPWVLRWALALTILSAVADRFGIWGPPGSANVSWGDWAHFVAYTAKVNSFLPGAVAPALAVMATVAEVLLGVALAFRRILSSSRLGERHSPGALRRRDDFVVRYQSAA
jgi:hypothetical protein